MSKLVCLEKYWDLVEANLAKAQLQNQGIIAMATGTAVNSVFGGIAGQLSPIELMVHECDVEEARLVLGSTGERTGESEQTEWKCTDCGEISPASFASCWYCHSDKPKVLPSPQAVPKTTSFTESDFVESVALDSTPLPTTEPYSTPKISDALESDPAANNWLIRQTEDGIERAWRAAMLSVIAPVTLLSFYALYLLLRYGTTSANVSRKHNVLFLSTLLLSLAVSGCMILLIYLAVTNWAPE
jgi:hypothetical protein